MTFLLSGGIDSMVLLGWMQQRGFLCDPLILNYGQSAWPQELRSSQAICRRLNVPLKSLEIPRIGELTANMLTRATEGQSPFFPNRNLLLLTIGGIVAYERGSTGTAIGVSVDAAYPDCSEEFLDSGERLISLSLGVEMPVLAPFADFRKEQIVHIGRSLGIPLQETYSCLRGGDDPCGRCDSCIDRHNALGAN